MTEVRVDKVSTKGQLREFISFPWAVYRGYPHWIPPLRSEMKEKLDRSKNPFFDHAEMDLFLARRDGQTSGRIAAILDENHNRFHAERAAFFGLYESANDLETAQKLVDTAERWARERGMEVLRGPTNLSMNDECGFLLEGFDSPPVIMMPYNPPYYLDLMQKCGLAKAKDLYAYFMSRDHQTAAKVGLIAEKTREETRITLRSVEKRALDRDLKLLRQVYNNAWEKNWGFVPMTDREFFYIGRKLAKIGDPNLVILAEDEGRPVGFALALPNFNEVLHKINGRLFPFGIFKMLYYRNKIQGLRGIIFGILREYRQTGLSYYLYSELEKRAQQKGYRWGEMSWLLEDNEPVNKFNHSVGATIYKKYRIFEKKIT
ncbi:MAG: GNAT family N-acetyltransferase [Acidobacteriota bacterium]